VSLPGSTLVDRSVAASSCPCCAGTALRVFHEQRNVPVNSCLLVDTEAEALAFPTGDLRLCLCEVCGFIFNSAFDPTLSEYSTRYEETQGFSAHFRRFAQDLARRWLDRYDLYGKRLVEIGCGKGEFLIEMCGQGGCEGVGIDPSYRPDRTGGEAAARVEFFQEFYGPQHSHLTGDALICRHTLEHIPDTAAFLGGIRATLADDGSAAVLFELPDVRRVLDEVAFWDVYYEHCSYFCAGSLARLFRRCGFRVLDLALDYADQYLILDAVTGVDDGATTLALEESVETITEAVAHFQSAFPPIVGRWSDDLRRAAASGQRVAIWGAGSKGVSYLTTLGAGREVMCAIDINPFKRGKFMAGTGHPVVAPEDVVSDPPDVVVAMNSVYVPEIQAKLDELAIRAELRSV